jgi:hypothetical protein
MNFVGLLIQFQVEVSEENLNTYSDSAPEERPNHPRLEQMRFVLSSRPSDVVTGKQAGPAQDVLHKALVTVERHAPPEWENAKRHLRPPVLPEVQADDLEDMGILVGEVYDEKIIEDSLHQAKNRINESPVNSNQD